MRILIIALVAALAVGCETQPAKRVDESQAKTPRPQNYKQQIVNEVKRSLVDPYSIRSAQVSEIFLLASQTTDKQWWTACFTYNAKNRLGGYAGTKIRAATFKDGEVIISFDKYGDLDHLYSCKGAKYKPFPELGLSD